MKSSRHTYETCLIDGEIFVDQGTGFVTTLNIEEPYQWTTKTPSKWR